MLKIGQRVEYRRGKKIERRGAILEIRPKTSGKTGRATAKVEWDELLKPGESVSWVSLSSLSPERISSTQKKK